MAGRLTWLLNGCYLWEGEVDSANIVHSRFASLLLFLPFSLPPSPTPTPTPSPSPELLVVMAVMTEKTKRREIVEMGGNLGREQAGRIVKMRDAGKQKRVKKGMRGIVRHLY